LGDIAVDEQFTIFGAHGAVAFSVLSGLLLHVFLPYRRVTGGEEQPSDRQGDEARRRDALAG
jgi:hypothetical protein